MNPRTNGPLPLMKWQDLDDEINRRHLDGKGQRLTFFSEAKHEEVHTEDADADHSRIAARLPCPFHLHVPPYSSFELEFHVRIDRVNGSPPVLRVREWDLHSDDTGSVVEYPLSSTADATRREWQVHRLSMETGWNGHHLVPEIWTAEGGTAAFALKDFTLTQVSESEGNRPPVRAVCSLEEGALSGSVAGIGPLTCTLPDGPRRFELETRFAARGFAGTAALALRWLAAREDFVAEDRCEFSSEQMLGGDSGLVVLRWRRWYGQAADGVSFAMTRHTSHPGSRTVWGEHTRLFNGLPEGVRKVRIHPVAGHECTGELVLQMFRLSTY